MRFFHSIYNFSSHYNEDVWSKVFRFNKNVKLFKYLACKRFPEIRYKFPNFCRFNLQHYIKRTRAPKNEFGSLLKDKQKARYFYGKLNQRRFRKLFWETKGKVAYSRIEFWFRKVELRPCNLVFRAGWFTDNLRSYQLAFHKYMFIDGQQSYFSRFANVGQIVSIPMSLFNKRCVIRRLKSGRYPLIPPYMMISFKVPCIIIWDKFSVFDLPILPVNPFNILRLEYIRLIFFYWH